MALNFGILSQVPSFGQQFVAGQQAAQAQQERNMLRQAQAEQTQFQRENMLAQRDERSAIAQERKARDARAAQRQQFLNGAAEALAQGGQKLDRPTLTKVLQSGIQADEPSLVQLLHALKRDGIAMVVIEHHMDLIMAVADRIVVLDQGRCIAQGTPREIQQNPAVIEAYLGRTQ